MLDSIASFIGYAIFAVIAGTPFAYTGGTFFNRMVLIRTHGSDANLDRIPATGFGGFLFWILGAILAYNLLEVKSFGMTLGYLLIAWVVLMFALHFVKEWYARINNVKTAPDKHRPF